MNVKAENPDNLEGSEAEIPVSSTKRVILQKTTEPRGNGQSQSSSDIGNDIEAPVIILGSEALSEMVTSPTSQVFPSTPPDHAQVHVAPNLLSLINGLLTTPEEQEAAKKQRDFNEIVHYMLVMGLIFSTILMLIGLGLDFILGREVPKAVPDLKDVFSRIAVLRPSGFLTLGMLMLIVTPILRVVGSIFAFIYERDWRYAGITFLVLVIVIASLGLSKG